MPMTQSMNQLLLNRPWESIVDHISLQKDNLGVEETTLNHEVEPGECDSVIL